MAYLTKEVLMGMGFKALGENVKVSDRASIYNPETIEIGDHSRIDDFCVISGRIKIGSYVHIAPFCLVAGGDVGITMADFSGLAYGVQVFSQSDDYSGGTLTNPTVGDKYKRERKAAVYIGRHVIIGASSIVFPGVDLADGCSVGAMTLVNKSTQPWGIYSGNPARRIKDRKRDLLALEAQFVKEQQE
ncbi:galactoside O-acetyltransferase [Marinobacter antarcticus]|uniref:Chloramphenicol acetyltransferase n=1 Tax=Marinobacter antarcticus TaxID=564117 RepID=A0A1M6RWM1_9GAMM|nr:acyltransferase [Marinobacter antarcticus]SHK36699.1 galactoside O-acetyltransferase [Marinobacter antarcticus]